MSSFSLLPTSSNEPTKKKQLGFPRAASFLGMNCTVAAETRVRGAPLALIHVSSSDPLPHLSIKNTPIETSSAQFIRQRYTAASSGQKLQNSITNAYGEAQDDHF
ncbi:BnaA06g13990D [Brassica napus]|uniref:BnaA06g13990D protein n=2 Tax=Brassica TaxID=3705 RepID=A0A078GW92_BRANA|nr:BnaA06g13990D [Brassica napus]VDC66164.1 unnamed protein product [Brassica rapa]